MTAHALLRLWATQALHAVQDWVVGRPLYLVDFHCFAIPQRHAPYLPSPPPPACIYAASCGCLAAAHAPRLDWNCQLTVCDVCRWRHTAQRKQFFLSDEETFVAYRHDCRRMA